MHTVLYIVLLILIKTEWSQCVSIPIVDSIEAFPFLRSVDTPTQIMRWDSGKAIQLLSSCKLVRITRRGVRCISSRDHLITQWQTTFSSFLNYKTPDVPTNNSYPWSICMPRSDALCVMEDGRRFFPTDKVLVADSSVKKCLNGQGRTLVGQLREELANTHTTRNATLDDISLCDVLDTNLDVIYDPVNNHVFTRQLSNSMWLYSSISILILAVVVLTAEAISQRTRSRIQHNIVAWLLLAGLSLVMLTNADGRMHPFVTIEDRAFVAMSFVYILVSTLYWAFSITESRIHKDAVGIMVSDTQRDGVNAMVGSIHFATCVLYGTPDNAYVSGFFFVFLFRCMQKIHDAHTNPSHWTLLSNTMLVLDVIYTTGIFSFGIIPHYTDDTESVLFAAAQFVICDTVAASYVANETTHTNDPAPLSSYHPVPGPNSIADPKALPVVPPKPPVDIPGNMLWLP
jgi:hypothetical protein